MKSELVEHEFDIRQLIKGGSCTSGDLYQQKHNEVLILFKHSLQKQFSVTIARKGIPKMRSRRVQIARLAN